MIFLDVKDAFLYLCFFPLTSNIIFSYNLLKVKHLRFVVHEHKARHLHYDFRLEMGVILKSWAIPKGPSMNPSDKRLAIMVVDHPIEYIDFEGIIPEGSYGAGPVVVWDTGPYEVLDVEDPLEGIKRGRLSFNLKGKKLKGIFTLALMKGRGTGLRPVGKEWLIMKKKDKFSVLSYTIKTEMTEKRLSKLKKRIPPCEKE